MTVGDGPVGWLGACGLCAGTYGLVVGVGVGVVVGLVLGLMLAVVFVFGAGVWGWC